jgi:signal transduction histidine kinase
MAFKEALNNILKHSRATEVGIGLTLEGGRLKILISDNGLGFDPALAKASGGDGLVNMNARLRQIDGRVVISSRAGEGTRVEMEAALK